MANNADYQKQHHWFVEALNSSPVAPHPADPLTSPLSVAVAPDPDYLFGIDKGFMPPPPVLEPPSFSVQLPAKEDRPIGGESPAVSPAEIQCQIQELKRMQIAAEYQEMQQRMQIVGAENQESQQRMLISAAAENQELHQGMQIAAAAEIQKLQKRLQIAVAAENQELQQRIQMAAAAAAASDNQELQRMRAAAENQQTTAVFQRNSCDEGRVLTAGGDYYLPRAPEKTTAPPATAVTSIPAGYWTEQRVAPPVPSRHAAVVGGGEPPRYMIPGQYDGGAAFYASVPRLVPTSDAYRDGAAAVPRMIPTSETYRDGSAVPRMVPMAAEAYRDGAAVYPIGYPPPTPSVKLASVPFSDVRGVAPQQGVGVTQGYTVAYDSAGRAMYYPGAYHQTVTNMGPVNPGVLMDGTKIVKPPQVS